MENSSKERYRKMTLEQKASLCSGLDFWHTKENKDAGISEVTFADGPHGLRKQEGEHAGRGLGNSHKATCFPPACTTSCSFDRGLMQEIGRAIALESRDQGVDVVLGPAVNIKRSPLCGRNFEYVSEDPYVAGEMATALIQGVQEMGVGTSIKHFAANNQETARFINDSIIDERAFREIYLAGFERAIKKAKPWTVMCSYNKINGTYSCENRRLLTEILRDEWGFDGVVMTDWAAMNNRSKAISAGLDLEMPGPAAENDERIVQAVKSRTLKMQELDAAVDRLARLADKAKAIPKGQVSPYEASREIARKAAEESFVLLKNEGILPLDKAKSLSVIGEFAMNTRYQGSGSSRINPTRVTHAFDSFEKIGGSCIYAAGYRLDDSGEESALMDEALIAASKSDTVIAFVGLPEPYESEAFDRTDIGLPDSHNRLVEKIAAVNPNVVVVIYAGAPVAMPWIDKVKAVLMAYLPGQEGAAAIPSLLYGQCVPCGKIAETFPLRLSDMPCYKHFGQRLVSEYRESIFVGYRYYDTSGTKVLFPFGHGLSYTQFQYETIELSKSNLSSGDTLQVRVKVNNVGDYDGKEIVQLYISTPQRKVFRPIHELKDFDKKFISKGNSEEFCFELQHRDFAFYNVSTKSWCVEDGTYEIQIGASSQDIRLTSELKVSAADKEMVLPDYQEQAAEYFHLTANGLDISMPAFESLFDRALDLSDHPRKGYHTINSTLTDISDTFVGRVLGIFVRRIHNKQYKLDPREDQIRMMEAMVRDMPLRSFVSFSDNKISKSFFEGLILMMNGKPMKGFIESIRALRDNKRRNKRIDLKKAKKNK